MINQMQWQWLGSGQVNGRSTRSLRSRLVGNAERSATRCTAAVVSGIQNPRKLMLPSIMGSSWRLSFVFPRSCSWISAGWMFLFPLDIGGRGSSGGQRVWMTTIGTTTRVGVLHSRVGCLGLESREAAAFFWSRTGEHRFPPHIRSLSWGPKGFPSDLKGGSINDPGDEHLGKIMEIPGLDHCGCQGRMSPPQR